MPLTGLERWDWTERPVLETVVNTHIRADPRFGAAQLKSIEGALGYCESHGEFQAAISDLGSFFLCGIALYLDVTGGITHPRLRELTGGSGLLSAGRARALLWRLRRSGFIEAAPDENKRFLPTPALRRAYSARARLDFEALQLLEPGMARMLTQFDAPQAEQALFRHLGEDMLRTASIAHPEASEFLEIAARSYGCIIMYAIAAGDGAPGTVPPVAALARRFQVSRSHVLRILRLMEKAGYLETDGERRCATPWFWLKLGLFLALIFATQLRIAHRVLLELAAD